MAENPENLVLSPRYSLETPLAPCDPEAATSSEDKEWLDAPNVGRESL